MVKTTKQTFGKGDGQDYQMSTPGERFLAARIDPFSTSADGARTLDEYSFPTSVRRVEQRCNLTTDSSGNAGVVFLPNLSDVSAFVGGVNRQGGGTLTSSTSAYLEQAIYASTLDSVMRSHRIVGWGVKVVWTQNVTAIQGAYTLAGIPCLGSGSWQQALDESSASDDRAADVYDALGVPYLGTSGQAYVDVSSLSALPYATASMPLAKGEDVYMVSKPTSAHSTFFRQSNARKPGNDAYDSSAFPAKAGAYDLSYQSKHGWEAFVLGVRGASASTQIAEITLVYHIEGIPAISNGAIRDAAVEVSPCNPTEQAYVAQMVASVPSTTVADSYRRAQVVQAIRSGAYMARAALPYVAAAAKFVKTKNLTRAVGTYNTARAVLGGPISGSRTTPGGLLLTSG